MLCWHGASCGKFSLSNGATATGRALSGIHGNRKLNRIWIEEEAHQVPRTMKGILFRTAKHALRLASAEYNMVASFELPTAS